MIVKEKIGKILIMLEFLDEPHLMFPLFQKFLPLAIEHHQYRGGLVYTGYCEDFEVVAEGELIPEYDAQMTIVQEDGKVEVKIIKK